MAADNTGNGMTSTQPATAVPECDNAHPRGHHVHIRPRDGMLAVIAVYKFVKAALLIAAGIGALKMLNPIAEESVRRWLLALSFAHGRDFLLHLLSRLSGLTDRRLQTLGVVAFAYAALFLVEGVGLWMAQRWAEYLVVIATASFVPVEVYEIMHGATKVKVVALIANLAMVAYLVYRLWHDRRRTR